MLTKHKIIYSSMPCVSTCLVCFSSLVPKLLLVLRLLSRNPNGLFWAGDTAQTISAGSSFRFHDLKAFLHRIEVRPIPSGLVETK
jgi:hypothetical protein